MATAQARKRAKKTKSKKGKDKEIEIVEETKDVVLTPQQALFLQLYYDRESPTWGNAKQSAIAAGFGHEYAASITYKRPIWWSEFVGQQDIASLVEQHFTEVLNMPSVSIAMGPFGPIYKTETIEEETGEVYKSGTKKGQPKLKKTKVKVPILVRDVSIIKEKTAVAKIAAPAHDPKYRTNGGGNKVTFNFNNVHADRDSYK